MMGKILEFFKNGTKNLFRSELFLLLRNKKNLISLLVLGIIILAIPLGTDLLRRQQILKSRAAADPIVFVASNDVFQKSDGTWVTKKPQVSLQLTSPLGPPAPSPGSSATLEPSNPPTPTPPGSSASPSTPPSVNGPCTYRPAGTTCVFDNRYAIKKSDGFIHEGVIAYGKYWNWELAPGATDFTVPIWQPPDGGNLESVDRYAIGPCASKPAGTACAFDTWTVFYDRDGSLQESITAYGKAWDWKIDVNPPVNRPWSPINLTSVGRYGSGPCASRPAGITCVFDNRYVIKKSDGFIHEGVIAYGKYWNWELAPGATDFTVPIWQPPDGGNLESVDRYAIGPCASKPAGTACAFDTWTVFYDRDGSLQESITAYGKAWDWKIDVNPPVNRPWSPYNLTTVGRYGN